MSESTSIAHIECRTEGELRPSETNIRSSDASMTNHLGLSMETGSNQATNSNHSDVRSKRYFFKVVDKHMPQDDRCEANDDRNTPISKIHNKNSAQLIDENSSKKHITSKNKLIPMKIGTELSKSDNAKNEIIFKNFLGATKNAIFRTAQNFIESHDKKYVGKGRCEDSENSKNNENTDFLTVSNNNIKNVPSLEFVETEHDVSDNKSVSVTSRSKLKVPGVVKCFASRKECSSMKKLESGSRGLLRFFESPVFNIHFAIHYLFYSKEPGVLSFIGNKIFDFHDSQVDLYIPQLIVMYIQMDGLAEVLDPYLTYRCRKSVDFSLKCLWLLEAYNFQIEPSPISTTSSRQNLNLMKKLYFKKDRNPTLSNDVIISHVKKTHQRSQSDATILLNGVDRHSSSNAFAFIEPRNKFLSSSRICLGDLTSGKAFDNGCLCFETVRSTVNGLLGQKTFCKCKAPKLAPQKEFMKALINIGRNLTCLQTKTEKTSALRMFLNLINKNLPARVWLPLYADIPHHIVRITEEKTAVLNSKDKTPYIIYVEVVEVDDIYSTPVIMKMMPSLRHTKSEENLDLKQSTITHVTNLNIESSYEHDLHKSKTEEYADVENDQTVNASKAKCKTFGHNLCFIDDEVWSQADDEITVQYMNLNKLSINDVASQLLSDSSEKSDQNLPALFNIGDVRTRHHKNLATENLKSFSNDPEDPSAAALKEPWDEKEKLIRKSSPYGHLSNWRLLSAIVKCGDDLRQELMATQLLQMFKIIWTEENVNLWVRPYKIVCLSDDSGLIEPIPNTVSVHQIKKNSNKSLRDYFLDEYGESNTESLKLAQMNFVQSCAAYCLISYLLQVKDRHNGNILLHADGHIIHIDFGFILSLSPKNLGFEQSPFKLTAEFVEVMGGTESELWIEFKKLLLKGLMAARKHMDRIINLVEIMRSSIQLPCFQNSCSGTTHNLRKRFHMNLTEQELERKVESLVQDSIKSLSTKLYDGYQYLTNGIL